MKRIALPLLLALSAAGCGLFEGPLERFYFPYRNLARQSLVYAYQPIGADSAQVEYWHFEVFGHDGFFDMKSTFYQPDFAIGQRVYETIIADGSLAGDVELLKQDTASGHPVSVHAAIGEGSIFSFQKMDTTESLRFSLDWHPPGDTSTTIFLKRTRRFLGDGPPFPWKGKNLPTVRFALREVVGNRGEGSAEAEGRGEEVYAEGLGLVFYKKDFDGGLHLAYRLVDVLDFTELERRAGHELAK